MFSPDCTPMPLAGPPSRNSHATTYQSAECAVFFHNRPNSVSKCCRRLAATSYPSNRSVRAWRRHGHIRARHGPRPDREAGPADRRGKQARLIEHRGTQQVAQSVPNGYTFLIVDSFFSINPGLRGQLGEGLDPAPALLEGPKGIALRQWILTCDSRRGRECVAHIQTPGY